MAILDFEACFPDSIVGFVPKRDVNLNFLFYLFTGMRSAFFSTATLNTQLNLNIERIGSLLTVVPSPKKQLQIVEFLDETCQRIDTIVEQIRAAASRLHEYRSALITAAVTGRIDVRANEEGGTN
jgi:type I restriction enzyme S subunit